MLLMWKSFRTLLSLSFSLFVYVPRMQENGAVCATDNIDACVHMMQKKCNKNCFENDHLPIYLAVGDETIVSRVVGTVDSS